MDYLVNGKYQRAFATFMATFKLITHPSVCTKLPSNSFAVVVTQETEDLAEAAADDDDNTTTTETTTQESIIKKTTTTTSTTSYSTNITHH